VQLQVKLCDPCLSALCVIQKQEHSYRQQIARQLLTQYAEGIYRHKYYTVTLKSIIHDLVVVELFDVEYYCDLQMWVRGH